jgi:hypothetical protein
MTTSSTKTNQNTAQQEQSQSQSQNQSTNNSSTSGSTSTQNVGTAANQNLSQNQNLSTSDLAPWQVQIPYLTEAFKAASGNLDHSNANTYAGPQVAQFTPEQLAIFKSMTGYGGNSTGADTSSSVGVTTANAGSNALVDALKGLNGFSPTGGTDSNIAAATAYANNPATDGMIDAAMRDARRSVSEGALPQIARNSAATGNTMSSRRAISEGIVERGLADKTADTSANIRGTQFNNGLALAESARKSDNSAILDALKSSAAAGGSAVGTGVGAIGSGITQQGGLFDLANAGGAGQQAATQTGIDNAKGTAEYANTQAAQNLKNFFDIVGGKFGGSTTTSSNGVQSDTGSQATSAQSATTSLQNVLSQLLASSSTSGTSNSTGTANGETTSTPSIWNTIGSALGMGSSLLKLSDRRLKTDVKRIGYADNGLPIYTFRYLRDPLETVEVGFMAQDVEKVRPEAVTEIGGIKHVNYELASA